MKKYIPTWQALESIGNNKLVKSSYIWIIIIPMVAKLLENIPENLEVPFYKNIIITLTLPFSWQLLYFSALSFAISTAIFYIFCPPLISKFPDIQEYKKRGLEKEQLITFFSTWLRKNDSTYDAKGKNISKESFINLFYKKYCDELEENALKEFKDNNEPAEKRIQKLNIKDTEFNNAFWFLRNVMVNDSKKLRIIITILYFMGFSMLLKLLIDNICAVININ